MLKSTFLFTGIFLTVLLKAQITITALDMPNAKDSVLISIATITDSSDATLTDTNYIWNYATLKPTLQRYEVFDAPSTFKSPYNLLFNQFNTSYGKNNYQFKSLPLPGTKIEAAYDFFKESAADYRQIGAGYIVNGAPLPFLYSKNDIIYRFPMNYLDRDTCDFKYGLPVPTQGYYGQTGRRINLVDGWGTLTTPFGTYSTIRIRSTIAAIDTIYIESLKFGTNIKRPIKREYKWFAVGSKIPVLQIDGTVVGDTAFTVTNVQFIDSLRSDIPHVGMADMVSEKVNFEIYPNPAQDHFIIQYSLQSIAAVTISMTDISGKEIYSLHEIRTAGENQVHMTTRGISNGIYFLKVQCNRSFAVQKLVIAN